MSNGYRYNFSQLRKDVEALCPFPFDTALCRDSIDDLINLALRKAFTKYEKVEQVNVVTGRMELQEAQAIVKVIPNQFLYSNNRYDLFGNFPNYVYRGRMWTYESMKTMGLYQNRVEWIFTPDRVLLIRYNIPCTVFYIKDPKYLSLEDLSEMYYQWVVKYACCLIKQKEAYMVTESTISVLPLDFNYNDLRLKAEEDMVTLEAELEDMFFGCFPNKS